LDRNGCSVPLFVLIRIGRGGCRTSVRHDGSPAPRVGAGDGYHVHAADLAAQEQHPKPDVGQGKQDWQ